MEIKGFHEVRCFIWYDGPLLSHFKDEAGKDYIVRWANFEDDVHFWDIIEMTPEVLNKYLKNEITLLNVIQETTQLYIARDTFVDEAETATVEPVDSMPEENFPAIDSFLGPFTPIEGDEQVSVPCSARLQ